MSVLIGAYQKNVTVIVLGGGVVLVTGLLGGLTARLGAGSQEVDHIEMVPDVDEDLQL